MADNTTPPPGLTLSSGGLLSGTPTTAGQYNPEFQVTDAENNSFSKNIPMTINPAGESLPDGSYAFEFSGIGPNGAVVIDGGFLLANQTVGVGFYDENVGTAGSQVSHRRQRIGPTHSQTRHQPNSDVCSGCASFHLGGEQRHKHPYHRVR
jgi:hypothetical protein